MEFLALDSLSSILICNISFSFIVNPNDVICSFNVGNFNKLSGSSKERIF